MASPSGGAPFGSSVFTFAPSAAPKAATATTGGFGSFAAAPTTAAATPASAGFHRLTAAASSSAAPLPTVVPGGGAGGGAAVAGGGLSARPAGPAGGVDKSALDEFIGHWGKELDDQLAAWSAFSAKVLDWDATAQTEQKELGRRRTERRKLEEEAALLEGYLSAVREKQSILEAELLALEDELKASGPDADSDPELQEDDFKQKMSSIADALEKTEEQLRKLKQITDRDDQQRARDDPIVAITAALDRDLHLLEEVQEKSMDLEMRLGALRLFGSPINGEE